MQAEVICTTCSMPYVACTKCGISDHCQNCGSIPENEVITPVVEVISSASTLDALLKGNSMLSTLNDARDQIQDAIREINDKISELQDAISELDDAEENITNLIDTLENVDGLSVSVDIDSYSFDVSVDL